MTSRILGELFYGNEVTITGTTGDWTAITYDGQAGYVFSTYVAKGSMKAETAATAVPVGVKITGREVADFALQYVGYNYRWGGASPTGCRSGGNVRNRGCRPRAAGSPTCRTWCSSTAARSSCASPGRHCWIWARTRLEEIYLPDREAPIVLDHHTPELQLVQRVRDEAHRCAITHHRSLRDAAFTHSQLEDIPGVGPGRRKALLKQFGSLKAIRAASLEELLSVKGMNRPAAEAVLAWAGRDKPQRSPLPDAGPS